MYKYYIPFFMALIVAYVMTPIAKKIAYKVGAIDVPKDERRVHKSPIPRLGGLAIYAATMLTFGVFILLGELTLDKTLITIVVGGTIIMLTGLFDDIKPMSPKVKLLGQLLAAFVLTLGNAKISTISNPFVSGYSIIELGILTVPATIFWVVGITNTLNLIDGLDGLAAGVGGIAALSLMFVAAMPAFIGLYPSLYSTIMILAAIVAGSAFGFLPHNFNPAKIFMGDTGALFLGYMLSVISTQGLMKSVTAVSFLLPIVILGLPIFDTAFAILRRMLNKRPIMEADKGHLHHRLLDRGLSQKQTVLTLYVVSISLGALAVFLTEVESTTSMILLAVTMTITLFIAMQLGIVDMRKKRQLKNSRHRN